MQAQTVGRLRLVAGSQQSWRRAYTRRSVLTRDAEGRAVLVESTPPASSSGGEAAAPSSEQPTEQQAKAKEIAARVAELLMSDSQPALRDALGRAGHTELASLAASAVVK